MPTIIHRLIIAQQGDDVEDEYENIPDYLRDMFWNFKVSDNLWLRVPKNFESGVLASGADRVIGRTRGYEDAMDGFGGSLAKAFIPVDEATPAGPFRPWIEAVANYDFFRQKNIVSPYAVNRDLDSVNAKGERIRNPENASRLGQTWQQIFEALGQEGTWMGRKFGDAKMADHLARGVFGEFGSFATRLSNVGRDDGKQLGLKDVGLFVNSPAFSAKNVQEVYKLAERNGLRQNKMFNDLDDLFTRYFNSRDSKQRDFLAREIRKEADRLKPILEREIRTRKAGTR